MTAPSRLMWIEHKTYAGPCSSKYFSSYIFHLQNIMLMPFRTYHLALRLGMQQHVWLSDYVLRLFKPISHTSS